MNLRMTGAMVTDHSYASGSGVYSLRERRYVEEYIAASKVDAAKLPRIVESAEVIGTLTPEAARLMGLPQGVRVAAGGVDNACMCLGAACTHDGDSYTSLGSSAWIAVASHEPVVNADQRPYVFAHCIPGMFASATSIFSAGNSFRWFKNTFFRHLEAEAEREKKDVYDLLTALAATAPAGSHKLIFNPSLAGGSGLDRSSHVRGCYTGLTLGHTAADMARATLEGICLNLRLAMDVLEAQTPLLDEMLIVGAAARAASGARCSPASMTRPSFRPTLARTPGPWARRRSRRWPAACGTAMTACATSTPVWTPSRRTLPSAKSMRPCCRFSNALPTCKATWAIGFTPLTSESADAEKIETQQGGTHHEKTARDPFDGRSLDRFGRRRG